MKSASPFRKIRPLSAAAFLTIYLILMSAFPGCNSRPVASHSPARVNVTFWHAMGLQHSKILNKIIAEFEKQNPDIHINSIYQGGYESLLTNLTASCTARTNPVISQMYESWTTRFLEHGLLKPMEELVSEYGGLSKESRQDIVRVFIEDNSWDGKLITLPFNKSAYVLYYNKDAMKGIGMVDEKGEGRAPVTWDEMRDACIKFTRHDESGTTRFGIGIRPFIEGYTTFLFRAGGRYLDARAKTVAFTDEAGRLTMNYLINLATKDKVVYIEPTYLDRAFGGERIAMYVSSTASIPYTEKSVAGKFQWDTAPIPYPAGSEKVARTVFQGTNIGIFKNHSPEKIKAAWRFVAFLTNTESATTWSVGTGYLPIRYSVLETPDMKEYLRKNHCYKAPIALLDNGIFEPRVLIWEPMRSVITDYFESALNGRRNPEETLARMKEKCESIILTF
jgi:multiple sugar transport system substrate-binding protein